MYLHLPSQNRKFILNDVVLPNQGCSGDKYQQKKPERMHLFAEQFQMFEQEFLKSGLLNHSLSIDNPLITILL